MTPCKKKTGKKILKNGKNCGNAGYDSTIQEVGFGPEKVLLKGLKALKALERSPGEEEERDSPLGLPWVVRAPAMAWLKHLFLFLG